MENNQFETLENEFYTEIREKEIKISDLNRLGVPDVILTEESLLRNVYGDKILVTEYDNDQIDVSKKAVTKVDLHEIEKMDEVKILLDELSGSQVNTNIDFLVAKICKKDDK